MSALIPTDRVHPNAKTDAFDGTIRWQPAKSLWLWGHLAAGLTGIWLFPQWDAALIFVLLSGLTICAGHSVGMHRLLIHRSFSTPPWLARLLVWLGTLVGMAGPFGMIRAHDLRDWHQRQSTCPPHPAHDASFWQDAWWQLCCTYDLRHPPDLRIEAEVAHDPYYRWIERTWMLQQLPPALLLFAFGGWAYVLWGISLRIAVSLIGHWAIGHFAHRRGHQGWLIADLPVQGYNLPGWSLLTFGENWHGNHHAFPHSAQLAQDPGQHDPGFVFIRILAVFGLAWDIQTAHSAPPRAGLTRIQPEGS